MLHLTIQTPILLASKPVDFRKGIDGLAAMCHRVFHQNPRSGTLFVFKNRSGTMIRILVYEHNGYWLMTKRLSKGRYRGWPKHTVDMSPIEARQLRQLLSNLVQT